jgi:hypothetical protein
VWGGWQVSGILYLRSGSVPDHAVAEHAVDRHHQQPAEPDLRSGLSQPTIEPVCSTPRASSRSPTRPARSATPAQQRARPGLKNIDLSVIKNTKFGRVSELRLEVFNLFNFVQFNNPNGQLGNARSAPSRRSWRARRARPAERPSGRFSCAVKLKF